MKRRRLAFFTFAVCYLFATRVARVAWIRRTWIAGVTRVTRIRRTWIAGVTRVTRICRTWITRIARVTRICRARITRIARVFSHHLGSRAIQIHTDFDVVVQLENN